jgi:DNA-directed RNA polymerase subunit RPC12/RpoP
MFCPKCGKEINSEVKFCPYCGQVLDNSIINKAIKDESLFSDTLILKREDIFEKTEPDKVNGFFKHIMLGIGTIFFICVIGLILCAIGLVIIGIPLIIIGVLVCPFMGFAGLNQIKGNCPDCHEKVTALKTDPSVKCPHCGLLITIKDSKFYHIYH